MQTTLQKKILEEKIFLSTLIPHVDLQATPKKEVKKKQMVPFLTPAMIDLIIQQGLS
jgi:hypothetical protein